MTLLELHQLTAKHCRECGNPSEVEVYIERLVAGRDQAMGMGSDTYDPTRAYMHDPLKPYEGGEMCFVIECR